MTMDRADRKAALLIGGYVLVTLALGLLHPALALLALGLGLVFVGRAV